MRSFIIAGLATAACTGIGSNDYELVRSRTQSLPIVLEERDNCITRLMGSTVSFDGEGNYRSAFRIEQQCPGQEPKAVRDPGASGSIQQVGDSIRFFDGTGTATGTGLLTADSLVVNGPIHQLIYYRTR